MRTPKLCSQCKRDCLGRPWKLTVADGKPARLCPNCCLRAESDAIREYKPHGAHPEAVAKLIPKVANVLTMKRARGGER
jgi:hypothetical protein